MDFSVELGQLLRFIADTAVAIRMHSAYSSGNPYRKEPCEDGWLLNGSLADMPPAEQSQHDVMWLADALHNLDCLGRALEARDPGAIEAACDSLVAQYRWYQGGAKGCRSNPMTSFRINDDLVQLEKGLEIFEAIKAKAKQMGEAL